MFSSRASNSPKNMDGGSACNCRQTPVSDGRSKSQRCSTYCLSTEPAPRRSTRSGSRVTRTQKGGKDGAPLGSNHPARLVRSHRRLAITKLLFFVLVVAALLALIGFFTRRTA